MIAAQGPSKARRRIPFSRLLALITAGALVAASVPARAQAPNLPVIRDAEVEQLLREYTAPILRAAGLAKQDIRVVIINDRSFNAFVADGRRIFVNAGALTDSTTPNQIIGVLAHETGHLAGGHLSRMREQLAHAQTESVVALLLGVGAMVAGARSGVSAGQAGAAIFTAPQSMIQNSLLAYARMQEEQADKAGVKFLSATGQSAKGMYETFKRFEDQGLFSSRYVNPYMQTHPMPADRVAALEELVKTSAYWDRKDSLELQARHDLMRAKLFGFLDRPDAVARRYPLSNTSLPARYARAISAYRFSGLNVALPQIDALIQAQPNNPYFLELKGQALLEGGHAAEAIAPLRHAIALAPNPTLIQILLGQALVATNDVHNADEAVHTLRVALAKEPEASEGYSALGVAYYRKGDIAQADLASAQAAFTRGDMKTARELAARAKLQFAIGSPGWVQADDIVSAKVAGARPAPN
jgi:predicted Zn-dependent protease